MNKKNIQLGMPLTTARMRLQKNILFSLLKETNKNFCYRCGAEIEKVEELSVEHKDFWMDSENPIEKFFDLDNIAFSHFNCNSKYKKKAGVKHPSHRAYNQGCRCDECKAIQAERKRKQRLKKKQHE